MINKKFFSRILFLTLVSSMVSNNLWGMDKIVIPKPMRPGQSEATTTANKKGHAILLLGTSSAGKSRICKQVSKYLTNLKNIAPVVEVIMDNEEDRGVDNTTRQSFPADWRCEHILLYQTIIQHTQQNNIVISDLVLFETKETDITESFIEKLKTTTTVTPVLIYCPLGQLLRNVESRNSSGESREHRSPLIIAEHYLDMYSSSPNTPRSGIQSAPPQLVDTADDAEFEDGEKALSQIKIQDEYDQKIQQDCRDRFRRISSRASSPGAWTTPIYANTNIYDMIFKNDGKKSEEQMGVLFLRLYNKLLSPDSCPENQE
ncbi:hypothetical protein CVU75_03525 [Candidatus Dependentiae bacterium HGW-Dependentiae-1]|nr:MAG: hypothetical protein CVU75_03525 [Candidatus Dependentiae bacterium HGW-Dependentiae-1]